MHAVNCTNKRINGCTYSTQLRPGGSNSVKHQPNRLISDKSISGHGLVTREKKNQNSYSYGKVTDINLGYIIKIKCKLTITLVSCCRQ